MTICLICNADIDTNTTPSTCSICRSPYHANCVEKAENGIIQNCVNCLAKGEIVNQIFVPGAPKPPKPKSKMGSNKTHVSENCVEIKALEEQLEMERRQNAAKLDLLEKSHKREKELMDKKLSLIREAASGGGSSRASSVPSVKSVESSKRRVKSWNADFENADKITPEEANAPTQTAKKNDNPIFSCEPKDPINAAKHPISSTRVETLDISPDLRRCVISRTPIKDLPKFDGDPMDWPGFYASYVYNNEVYNIKNAENLIRLQNSLKGDALAAVKSTLIYPEGVPDAMIRLERLFGRPEYIINKIQTKITEFVAPREEKLNSIIEFATYVESMVLTMVQAKLSDHLRNPALISTIIRKLPMRLQHDWTRYQHQELEGSVDLEVLNKWLTERSMECCSLLTAPPTFKSIQDSKIKPKNVNIHEDKKESCLICKGDCSSVVVCGKFLRMSYKEKWSAVNESLCRHCLKPHKGRCFSKVVCGVDGCIFKHHKLLHKDLNPELNEDIKMVTAHFQRQPQVYFKIVPITLCHGDKELRTFALLDDGSQVTLAEKWIFDDLGLTGVNSPLTLKWTGNQHRREEDSILFTVMAKGPKGNLRLDKVHTVLQLDLPTQTFDVTELQDTYEHLQGLPLTGYENAKPCILIGLDNAKLLTTTNVKEGRNGQPIAVKSKFGWLVFGNDGDETSSLKHNFHLCECQQDESSLNDVVRKFIALDNLYATGNKNDMLSIDDRRALEMMKATTSFIDGRYEIGLLWRFENVKLPDSFPMAVRRLECLEKQMKNDSSLRQKFSEQIQSYVAKGYARKLSSEEASIQQPCWYLPMFLVKNHNKPDKIRPVWDAAALVKNVSLNSTLLTGPDQLAELPGVLSRFRQFKIGIGADVKEMFHQIRIREQDQQFQRFLWRDDPSLLPEVYVMSVMTFGAKCSPSCSQFIKNFNAEKFVDQYPRAVESVIHNHYVDDMLDSVETEADGSDLIEKVKFIHSSGGFEIRGWLSNSSDVLQSVGCSPPSSDKDLNIDIDSPGEKVLGMWWNTKTDMFTYSLKLTKSTSDILDGTTTPTKRQVLSVLASIYDPLGFLSHFLIYPKILMQDIWRTAIGWNDEIGDKLLPRWKSWVSALKEIESIQIPRWYNFSSSCDQPELHVFVDASLEAYSAACYIRFKNQGDVVCRLVLAKSKVSPLKSLSVPRLELNAAVLGARMAEAVKRYHTIKFARTTFWTDSRTVWSWVRSESRNFQQFVAFRISEIHETSMPSQWRWLESKLNIADVATRSKIPVLTSGSEWFIGPNFLYQDEDKWPEQVIHPATTDELKTCFVAAVHIHQSVNVERFSNWHRLRRTQAYVLRFNYNMLAKVRGHSPRTGILARIEYLQAENILYKQAQESSFNEEYTMLADKKQLQGKSLIKKYLPYIDNAGVIRCKSRIDVAESALTCTKRPILLPGQHYITQLILKYYHELYLHIHHETAITCVMQKFEVPKLRVEMGKVRSQCQFCKNLRSKPVAPVMANLPPARLSTFSRPFTFVGIDYFGPLKVVTGRNVVKRWGVIITCLSIRAVHLEISPSLSTESCIMALKRFMSRRGVPTEIFSDQGTNFKGAEKELRDAWKEIDQQSLAESFVTSITEWHFNPPASPHMGGAWERLVRTVKDAIYKSYPLRTPTDELLLTMFCEVECMVNSRPLTFLPISSEQGEVLTPNHFLLGSANGNKPFGKLSNDKEVLINNWRKSQQFTDRFHKHFTKVYLPVLRRRTKWFADVEELKKGDIVLVVEENVRPEHWKRAKIIDVKSSRDGQVRQATIQSASGVYDRPAVKLAKLDIEGPTGTSMDNNDSSDIPGGSVTSSPTPITDA